MKERLLSVLVRVVARLPWSVLRQLGRFIGWVLYRLNGRDAYDTRVNLSMAFPQLDAREREQLVRATLRQTATTYIEMPRIWLSDEDLSHRVDDNGLPQVMARLAGQGNGLVLAMPLHGNWEIVSQGFDKSLRVTGLYRRPRQAFLDPIMTRGREIAQINMVPTDRSGIKALHGALRNSEVIAILPDQVPKSAGAAGVVAPFYGHDAMTMILLARLAAKHASPVLFAWAERQPDGRYSLRYFEADETIRDADPLTAATALNQAVEQVIATHPDQYQWAYRRYRVFVPGYPNPYARP